MARLRTDFFVAAYRVTCEAAGAFVVFLNKGDAIAGAVYIRLRSRSGALEVYEPVPNFDNPDARAWMRSPVNAEADDAAADAFVAGILKRDPDAWIVDVDGADATCRPSPIVEV
ncbi:MAG: DUF1491 family protein [Rhodobiaceae bacterium]|nr:DUF1491 family protein [Rhodobiaceae bacterium]